MNDKLEDKNLEDTLNVENTSKSGATEKELKNYNEILSFLKEWKGKVRLYNTKL